jgi:ribulose-5-phosphate 4-epimerase/fuculose-1-phosphate aldolase
MTSSSRRHFLGMWAVCAGGPFLRRDLVSAVSQTPDQSETALIDDIVAANRILANEQVLDAFGHVSARHPRIADHFLLARSVAPELVTRGDIMEYDLDGNAVEARGRTSYRERFIHGEIYRARSNVRAIVHCHTPSLIPFGVVGLPLRPVYHQSAFVAEGVPVFEIRNAAGMTDMLIKDSRLGKALAQTLGDKPAALMRGHGAVIVGDSIPTVVGRSVYLDLNARLQAQAMALGRTVTYLDPEEARLYVSSDNYGRAWELWKRKIGGATAASPRGR